MIETARLMIDLEVNSTNSDITLICNRYWQLNEDGEFVGTVKTLATEYGLSEYELRKLVKKNSTARSKTLFCDHCGDPYIFNSRTDFHSPRANRYYDKIGKVCKGCSDELEEIRRAEYEEVLEKRKAELLKQNERKRALALEQLALLPEEPYEITNLSLEDAIFLISLIRYGSAEDFAEIRPLQDCEGALAPTGSLTSEIINKLLHRNLIGAHPGSNLDSFIFEEEKLTSFYTYRVSWKLHIGRDLSETANLILKLEKMIISENWIDSWHNEWILLWRKIALNECLEYLNVQMKERDFDFNPGEKSISVFNQLLDHYSVAQAYNFIWSSAKSAADFLVRKKPPKQQAANSVITNIQRKVERARDEKWDIKAYNRDFRCPRSMISHVLFTSAMQMGDEGFTQAPGSVMP